MRSLGKYILSGTAQAVGVISFLSIFSLIIPPSAFLLSGTPLAMLTLRKGAKPALQVMAGSLCLCLLLTLVTGIEPLFALILLLTIWLPVWLCAVVLRVTESQVYMALTAALIGFTFVVFMYLYVGDVEGWWRSLLTETPMQGFPGATEEQYKQIMELAPPLMNAAIASSIVFSLLVTLFLGRCWQASLFNPGGFGEEFRAFRLPRQLALPTMLGIGLLFLEGNIVVALVRDTLAIVLTLYLIQGVVAVHRTVKLRGLARNWLVAMYCLLFILPQIMVIFLAWMGITDSLMKLPKDGGEGKH